jgi:putative transposase
VSRCRTFRYRLYPTVRQKAALEALLLQQCELYNAALEERRGAWRWERRSVSYFDQCKSLTGLGELRPEVLSHGVVVCRGTLKHLDWAFCAFYRRVRNGEAPGFPRFKAQRRFDSVQYEDASGWKLKEVSSRLHLLGVGHLKIRLHRPIRGQPKALTVGREGRRWFASVRCVQVPATLLPATGKAVGIDLGVGVLVATSDGELIENGRVGRSAASKLARAQRALSRKTTGSARRRLAVERVAETHRRIRNTRRDVLHKLSRRLVNENDLIVHEALNVRNMVRRAKSLADGKGGFAANGSRAKSSLNFSILDAGWGTLLQMISYKAEEADRRTIEVDPKNTSRRCSACGHTEAGNRRGEAFECLCCGYQAHADTNAAMNILRAGRALRSEAA